MVRVVFNDSSKIHKCEFNLEGQDVILLGKIEKNTSGFKVFRSNGDIIGDYSDYRNVKEVNEKYIILSKED